MLQPWVSRSSIQGVTCCLGFRDRNLLGDERMALLDPLVDEALDALQLISLSITASMAMQGDNHMLPGKLELNCLSIRLYHYTEPVIYVD